jgi:glycosyltransferase involved in cell wall biosynthesis
MIRKENIKVSIVTPSYNQGQFIEETILSVLNQTYKNIEYILVDGGSTDNTMDIVNKYRDKIAIVISEKDKGQSDAINKGFKLATGVLAGWINSDDIIYPECIERLVNKYLEFSSAAVYYNSSLDVIDKNGKWAHLWKHQPIPDKKYLLTKECSVVQPTSFYNRNLLEKIGYLNERLHYCMDFDLWLRLLEYGPICEIGNVPLGAIREWGDSKTSTGGRKFLREIRKTLVANGAKFNRLILRTYFYEFKVYIKSFMR